MSTLSSLANSWLCSTVPADKLSRDTPEFLLNRANWNFTVFACIEQFLNNSMAVSEAVLNGCSTTAKSVLLEESGLGMLLIHIWGTFDFVGSRSFRYTCLKMACVSKTVRRAKRSEIWDSGIPVTHMWSTFDFVGLNVILCHSSHSVDSKCLVTQKRLAVFNTFIISNFM